ncbi:MAG: ATP-binding protein [Bacteroidota bacterium]
MEKEIYSHSPLRRILITGPESTGKSDLSAALASSYGGVVVPEYAREYIEHLGRPYEYDDLEHIARQQVKEYEASEQLRNWIFFDTWLIITRVWFEVVYGSIPAWIDDRIRQARFDMVLLCGTDLPWIFDPVRENGGEKREKLLEKYKYELDRFGLEWALVTGTGHERLNQAMKLINLKFHDGTTREISRENP